MNTRGFRLYKQQKYGEALELFRKATELDPHYALAQYNMACTLGVLYKQGKICEYDAYRSTIVQYLRRSVELDPGRRKRMLTDPDLEPVHDTFDYQILSGLRLDKESDVRLILQRVTWYTGPSLYISRMNFFPDGRVKTNFFYMGESDSGYRDLMGRYNLKGRRVRIRYRCTEKTDTCSPGEFATIEGELKSDGTLQFSESSIYSDDPDPCSA